MSNVVILPVVSRIDQPVERILDRATAANLTAAVVIGYDQDGDEFFASSYADGGEVLWLLERAKLKLLTIDK